MWRFYIAVAYTAFRRQLIYRWANLAGLLTNLFFCLIFSYVMIALFQVRTVVAGYTLRDTLNYTWLIQAMIMVVAPFGWYELMLTIRSGEVVTDLSKPCNFYWYWFSQEMGRNFYYFLFRALPIYAIGILLFDFELPHRWEAWSAFLLAFPVGVMLGVAYRMLCNVAAFWILEARALVGLGAIVGLFFSGSYIPIPFFPVWLKEIVDWLPFNGLMNMPVEVLLGKRTGSILLLELLRQVLWLVVLTWMVQFLISRATKRIVIQGG